MTRRRHEPRTRLCVVRALRRLGCRELRSRPVARAWHVGAAWIALRAASNRPCGASVFEGCVYEFHARAQIPDWAEFGKGGLVRGAHAERRSPRGDRLRGQLVFLQLPAEPVATAEAIELQRL
jgi:hypothetical protein